MAVYDVFLSHNSADKADVVTIAQQLRNLGLRPWFDEWDLVPGASWQEGLVEGVNSSICAALFVGDNGVGSWQNAESMLLLNRAFTDPSFRLIPVVLPGAPAEIESAFPGFVRLFTWVDLRGGIDDAISFERLVAGIRGEPPGPTPYRVRPRREAPRLADLDRCLTVLGVPDEDLQAATKWLALRVTDQRSTAEPPGTSWSAAVQQAVVAFQQSLVFFVWPERLLETSFYLSTSKLARMYRAHRPELGDQEESADRFRVLHRYLHERGRLAFAPSLLLLNDPLPSGDDTWLYFSGDFSITLNESIFAAVPQAREIIQSTERRDLYNLVAQIFGPTDPFFLPILEFHGQIGERNMTMLMSRKYVGIESASATALGSALFGDKVSLSGFGTLIGDELQPVICRLGQREW